MLCYVMLCICIIIIVIIGIIFFCFVLIYLFFITESIFVVYLKFLTFLDFFFISKSSSNFFFVFFSSIFKNNNSTIIIIVFFIKPIRKKNEFHGKYHQLVGHFIFLFLSHPFSIRTIVWIDSEQIGIF